jgi:molybdopterin synthase sulfur carrier subunit
MRNKMATKIRIPTPLQSLTEQHSEVVVEGSTVGEALASLESSYPAIRDRLRDENGKLRRFINLYVNDEDIRFLDNEATPLKDSDEISIVPAIAGG